MGIHVRSLWLFWAEIIDVGQSTVLRNRRLSTIFAFYRWIISGYRNLADFSADDW
jgi:hypothetical protein